MRYNHGPPLRPSVRKKPQSDIRLWMLSPTFPEACHDPRAGIRHRLRWEGPTIEDQGCQGLAGITPNELYRTLSSPTNCIPPHVTLSLDRIGVGPVVDRALPSSPSQVRKALGRVHKRLQVLLQRHSELENEIRELRKMVHQLFEISNSQSREAGNAKGRINTKEAVGNSETQRFEIKTRATNLARRRGQKRVTIELERACRIALVEANEPASLEEIYDRITRRDSFFFGRYKYPLLAISRALNKLLERGEAITVVHGENRAWQLDPERDAMKMQENPLRPEAARSLGDQ